jgi:hypothetical protein
MEPLIEEINLNIEYSLNCSNRKCSCDKPINFPSDIDILNNHLNPTSIIRLNCGHAFHADCIKNLDNCPFDNTYINLTKTKDLIKSGKSYNYNIA